MPSVYSVLKKSVPYCESHRGIQALYYNVENMEFLCSKCMEEEQESVLRQQDEGKSQNSINVMNEGKIRTFPLQQIIQNPVLLMLKQQSSSFLSKIDHSSLYPTNYRIPQYRRIVSDIDYFIKTKKHTQQFTQQFFHKLRQEVNARIDNILAALEDNQRAINELQQKAMQLKGIKKAYSNQFLQTLQTSFVNNTQAQLKKLLKKYSVENQNPFRKIDEIVNEITKRVTRFVEVNWEHVMGLESRLLDGYIWNRERVFLVGRGQSGKDLEIKSQKQLYSSHQSDMILPYSVPHRLQWHSLTGQQSNLESNHPLSIDLYIRCTRQSIELLTKQQQSTGIQKFPLIYHHNKSQDSLSLTYSENKQNQRDQKDQHHGEEQFVVIDTYNQREQKLGGGINHNNVMPIDLLYELPQKRLLAVCYQGLTFYSSLLGKLTKLSSIPSIKGTSQVLIFEHYCLILTTTQGLYQINYHQLNRPINLGVRKLKENQIVQAMSYLYKDRRKLEKEVLLTVRSKDNNGKQESKRQLRLGLDQCESDDDD